MGQQPLITNHCLLPLYNWLSKEGNNTLYTVSSWFDADSWIGWNFGDFPPDLNQLIALFKASLRGCGPQKIYSFEQRGWWMKNYLAK
jgi:hypothetical protein